MVLSGDVVGELVVLSGDFVVVDELVVLFGDVVDEFVVLSGDFVVVSEVTLCPVIVSP